MITTTPRELSYERPRVWDLLGYEPFDWQVEHCHARSEKRIVLACARRSGKTLGPGAHEALKRAFEAPQTVGGRTHAPIVYIGAPTYELSMRVWEQFEALTLHPGVAPAVRRRDRKRYLVEFQNGARAQAKTGEKPMSWQGERVTAGILDECQEMPEAVWGKFLPSLLDSGGSLIAMGVPVGTGRFRSMWELGQSDARADADGVDYYSASVPSTANPLLNPAFVEEQRRDLTEIEFQQQILGQWAERDGAVFHDIDRCFTGCFEPPSDTMRTVMGLDLAQHHDFTVAYVLDIDRMAIVHRYRKTGLDYDVVIPQIAKIYRDYHCQTIHTDATGVGAGVVPFLRNENCSVSPFTFSNPSKAALISRFNAEIEHGRVIFPREDDQLRRELRLFSARSTTAGSVQYGAPPNFYDDCVIAAALAVAKGARNRPSGPGARPYVDLTTSPSTARNRRRLRMKRSI